MGKKQTCKKKKNNINTTKIKDVEKTTVNR